MSAHDPSRRTRQVGARHHCLLSYPWLPLPTRFMAWPRPFWPVPGTLTAWSIEVVACWAAAIAGFARSPARAGGLPESAAASSRPAGGVPVEDAGFQRRESHAGASIHDLAKADMTPARRRRLRGRCRRSRRRPSWRVSWTSRPTSSTGSPIARPGSRRPDEPLRHYRYRWWQAIGSLRLIEAPKPRLNSFSVSYWTRSCCRFHRMTPLMAFDPADRSRRLSASCRPNDRAQDGPPGFLRFDHRCRGSSRSISRRATPRRSPGF